MKKLKLNDLAKQVMTEREMQQIRGGVSKTCGCGCVNNNTGANASANSLNGLSSPNMSGKWHVYCTIIC